MGIIVCYSKCWDCQFGCHPGGTHTWMDNEDIEFSKDVQMPGTTEEWDALGASHPCGCWCVTKPVCEPCHGSGADPANEDYPCRRCEGSGQAEPPQTPPGETS